MSFAGIDVPVKVFGASDPQGVQFRELHASDGAEIAHELVDADGRKVDRRQVVKGFELRAGEYVVLDDDELKAASAPKRKTVDIEHFVPREQIDPDVYDRPYYLAPQKGGDEAYALLAAALRRTGRVGVGRVVLRSREQLAAVVEADKMLRLHTMRFADELVDPGKLDHPPLRRKPDARLRKMAAPARRRAVGRVRARALPRHLPRPRARSRQAQGQGRGDRRRARAGARALRRPRGRARGEPEGLEALMARARPLWSGSLSFGLVNVPVALVSAVRDQAVHFHQIHKKTHERLHVSYVCTKEKPPVDYSEIAHGFDTGDGYVMLTDEELAAAQPEKTRTIEISKFVALEEIDPILFDHPYYLLPAGEGEGPLRAYRLLTEVMADAEQVAIGQFVLRTKEYLVAVRAKDDLLALTTMLFPQEVRPTDELDLPDPQAARQGQGRPARSRSSRRSGPTSTTTPTRTATAAGCASSSRTRRRARRSRLRRRPRLPARRPTSWRRSRPAWTRSGPASSRRVPPSRARGGTLKTHAVRDRG